MESYGLPMESYIMVWISYGIPWLPMQFATVKKEGCCNIIRNSYGIRLGFLSFPIGFSCFCPPIDCTSREPFWHPYLLGSTGLKFPWKTYSIVLSKHVMKNVLFNKNMEVFFFQGSCSKSRQTPILRQRSHDHT